MSAFSDYAEDKVRQFWWRTGTPTKPTALYHALFTAAPGETGGGTEVSGGAYARVNLAPGDANWTAPDTTGGLTDNASAITYAAPTANWGVVSHFAQIDASSGGNYIIYGALAASKTINNGDAAPSWPIGSLDLTVA
jgi:hypothetical protein